MLRSILVGQQQIPTLKSGLKRQEPWLSSILHLKVLQPIWLFLVILEPKAVVRGCVLILAHNIVQNSALVLEQLREALERQWGSAG